MIFRRIIFFAAIIFFPACRPNEPTITVKYTSVGNLKKGDRVSLNGVMVGEVLNFNIVQHFILANLLLQKSIKLPVDSRFFVRQSLLGPARIEIEPSDKTEFIARADTVLGESYEEPVLDSTKQIKIQAAFRKMGEGFAELVQALDKDSIRNSKKGN